MPICQLCHEEHQTLINTVDLQGRATRQCIKCHFPGENLGSACYRCRKWTVNKQPWRDGNIYCRECSNEVSNESWQRSVYGAGKVTVPTANLIVMQRCSRCQVMHDNSDGQFRRLGFICNDCLEEDHNVMYGSIFHVRVNARGATEEVDFFLWLLRRLDSDWPSENAPLCKKCGGASYKNPRFNPEKIKEIGKLCGVRKVKVKYWGKADKCEKQAEGATEAEALWGMVN